MRNVIFCLITLALLSTQSPAAAQVLTTKSYSAGLDLICTPYEKPQSKLAQQSENNDFTAQLSFDAISLNEDQQYQYTHSTFSPAGVRTGSAFIKLNLNDQKTKIEGIAATFQGPTTISGTAIQADLELSTVNSAQFVINTGQLKIREFKSKLIAELILNKENLSNKKTPSSKKNPIVVQKIYTCSFRRAVDCVSQQAGHKESCGKFSQPQYTSRF